MRKTVNAGFRRSCQAKKGPVLLGGSSLRLKVWSGRSDMDTTELNTKIVTRFATTSMTNTIRAITRIAHLNLRSFQCFCCACDPSTYPMSSIKLLEAIGMAAPPIDDPVAAIPNAIDLRFLNQCEIMIGIEPKIIPQDIPTRKPWQRTNCQNSLHSAVTAVPTTKVTLVSCL